MTDLEKRRRLERAVVDAVGGSSSGIVEENATPVAPYAEEIHVTSSGGGGWIVKWRRMGGGFRSEHFGTTEGASDYVRRLLFPGVAG